MYYFEVYEIGRESVKSVNASVLASLIKELVNRYERGHKAKLRRKYYIRCNDKLELSPKKHKKIGDDEGFESDGNEEDSLSGELSNEDAQSTTSSCCMVEDHVFKTTKPDFIRLNAYGKEPTSLVSILGSIDSANSSGSSDTDEIEIHSLTPSPTTQTKSSLQKQHEYFFKANEYENTTKKSIKLKKEEYAISDVIFCHTEPKYPTVIAWVIKKPQSDFGSRLGITGVEKIENCLEIVVIKCKNTDNLRELCSNYQEYSRRTKLDNYKSIKRKNETDQQKKSITMSPLSDSKDVKVSLSDLKIANSGLIKASELSILNPKIMTSFRNDLKNSISLNSLIKSEKKQAISGITSLESKSSANVTLQPSVKTAQNLLNLPKSWESENSKNTASKDKNVDIGDQFNLVQRTDQNGVTHLEVTKSRENKSAIPSRFTTKSKLRKEIEGVILTDVESYAKREYVRQRNGSGETDSKDKIYECPPIRPQRRKYTRKKNAAPPPPVAATMAESKVATTPQLSPDREKPKTSFFLSPQSNGNQVKNEQKAMRTPFVEVQTWRNQNVRDSGMKTWRSDGRGRHVTKNEEKSLEKRRSTSAGRPVKKAPMAYRYIYFTNDYRDGVPVRRGIPSKIRDVGENLTNSICHLRRRNSFDDMIICNDNNKSNLKSVIKKNKKINDKYCEPKKVTFSAFATVQVVD